jgi:hypothetical protein
VKRRKTGEHHPQYLANAIIYGPVDLCEQVGNYLSQCKMFLQDPIQCERDVPYLNPHLLAESPDVVMTSAFAVRPSSVEVETLDAPQDFFSQLSDDHHLQLTKTPNAICTPLYT